MEYLVNALIAAGLLLILVLIIYLIDRINLIERETFRVMNAVQGAPEAANSDPFLGLNGKKLWDTMMGKSADGFSGAALSTLRSHYEVVLPKHIESLFRDGFNDGQKGQSAEPRNPRAINTSRGQIESWLPTAQVNTLYQCGLDAAGTPADQWGPIRNTLDEAGQLLYAKVQLASSSPLSEWLMPEPTKVGDLAVAQKGV